MTVPGSELLRRASVSELGERWLAKKGGRPVWIWVSPPLKEKAGQAVVDAEAVRTATHPFLAETLELGTSEGHAYQVMSAEPSEDLRTLGALPPSVAAKIVHDAARGLAHARTQGRIHGRLQSELILVGFDGSVSVMGLGFAAAIAKLSGLAPISPEAKRGAALSPSTDVHALGLILAEAAGGMESIPAALRAVVARATSEDPSLRHADAGAFADAVAGAAAVEFKALPPSDDLGQFMRTTFEARLRELGPVFSATSGIAFFGPSVGQLFATPKPRTSSASGRGSGPSRAAGSGPAVPAANPTPSGGGLPAGHGVPLSLPPTPETKSSLGVIASLLLASSAAFLFGLLYLGPRVRHASSAPEAIARPDPAPRLRRLPALSVPSPSPGVQAAGEPNKP